MKFQFAYKEFFFKLKKKSSLFLIWIREIIYEMKLVFY